MGVSDWLQETSETLPGAFYIVAGGQFLNSWNWDPQAPGSGSYRLGQGELDRREFARVGNPLARPNWARLQPIEADLGQIRPPRIRQGRESAKTRVRGWGRAGWRPAWMGSTAANSRGSGIPCLGPESAYMETKSFRNTPQTAPNENVCFHEKLEFAL